MVARKNPIAAITVAIPKADISKTKKILFVSQLSLANFSSRGLGGCCSMCMGVIYIEMGGVGMVYFLAGKSNLI